MEMKIKMSLEKIVDNNKETKTSKSDSNAHMVGFVASYFAIFSLTYLALSPYCGSNPHALDPIAGAEALGLIWLDYKLFAAPGEKF